MCNVHFSLPLPSSLPAHLGELCRIEPILHAGYTLPSTPIVPLNNDRVGVSPPACLSRFAKKYDHFPSGNGERNQRTPLSRSDGPVSSFNFRSHVGLSEGLVSVLALPPCDKDVADAICHIFASCWRDRGQQVDPACIS